MVCVFLQRLGICVCVLTLIDGTCSGGAKIIVSTFLRLVFHKQYINHQKIQVFVHLSK